MGTRSGLARALASRDILNRTTAGGDRPPTSTGHTVRARHPLLPERWSLSYVLLGMIECLYIRRTIARPGGRRQLVLLVRGLAVLSQQCLQLTPSVSAHLSSQGVDRVTPRTAAIMTNPCAAFRSVVKGPNAPSTHTRSPGARFGTTLRDQSPSSRIANSIDPSGGCSADDGIESHRAVELHERIRTERTELTFTWDTSPNWTTISENASSPTPTLNSRIAGLSAVIGSVTTATITGVTMRST